MASQLFVKSQLKTSQNTFSKPTFRARTRPPEQQYLLTSAPYKKGQMMSQIDLKNPNQPLSRKPKNIKNYYMTRDQIIKASDQSKGFLTTSISQENDLNVRMGSPNPASAKRTLDSVNSFY